MGHKISARMLLTQAKSLYDNPQLPFAQAAISEGWRTGFASGANWMRLVLSYLRKEPLPMVDVSFNHLGTIKYCLALMGAITFLAVVGLTQQWYLIIGVVVVFYAIEAQMVFLFPLALDGHPDLFRTSREWTRRAGGTLPVMLTVLQLAAVMLAGGFVGQGFIRSWALGCLAVVLWYEAERQQVLDDSAARYRDIQNETPQRERIGGNELS